MRHVRGLNLTTCLRTDYKFGCMQVDMHEAAPGDEDFTVAGRRLVADDKPHDLHDDPDSLGDAIKQYQAALILQNSGCRT